MQKLRIESILIALSAFTISACTADVTKTATPRITTIDIPSPPVPQVTAGLERVLGLNVSQLRQKFGAPRLDVREANGRKLQFYGKACIMDVYLYAPEGRTANEVNEIVTHIDTRRSDGAEVDRLACVNALKQ